MYERFNKGQFLTRFLFIILFPLRIHVTLISFTICILFFFSEKLEYIKLAYEFDYCLYIFSAYYRRIYEKVISIIGE
ncbi:hypothetical protein WN943_027560 [Citrus x changshan-huyou]